VHFDDPDGDVEKIGAAVTFSGSRSQVGPTNIVPSPGDLEEGTVAVGLSLTAPVAGTYELEVRLVDAADNDSNKLKVNVTAQ
jgi:hypothetical protein